MRGGALEWHDNTHMKYELSMGYYRSDESACCKVRDILTRPSATWKPPVVDEAGYFSI